MTVVRIDCDARWHWVTGDPAHGPDGLDWFNAAEPIPLTPRAAMWIRAGGREPPNALASALLTFLQLPIRQLQGPAYLTGLTGTTPTDLSPAQQQAFSSTLRALTAMPDYLALHAQAGRIAAAWFCPANDGSST